ncbi:MAG: metallophosphoesterase family protein, partial [Thermodesulfobacteriota bacterium]|nr:metallophosphoesterase family protein [Thermodesulfobacteriota bacterium]
AALHGCDLILHAGDIDHQGVLDTLASIAPVVAVRGNMDRGGWADRLPVFETVTVAGADIYMRHDLLALDLDPAGYFAVVIHGHTHSPSRTVKDGVLYFNPGSAGPRRSGLPVSVGLLTIDGTSVEGSWVMLDA